jgi:hypothetical protein
VAVLRSKVINLFTEHTHRERERERVREREVTQISEREGERGVEWTTRGRRDSTAETE